MKLLDKITADNKVAGMEIVLGGDGVSVIRYIILERKGKTIGQLKAGEIQGPEQLTEAIPKNIPVALVINGKGILNRKLAPGQNQNEGRIVEKILPNANPADFYSQLYENDTSSFGSLIRKEAIDPLAASVLKTHSILFCTLGPFIAEMLLPLLPGNNDGGELRLPDHTLTYSENRIISLESGSNPVQQLPIGADTVGSAYLAAYAAAFSGILDLKPGYAIQSRTISNSLQEHKYKKKFIGLGYATVAVFLVLLLLNFFLFEHYNQKNGELQQQLSAHQLSLQLRDSLKAELERRGSLLSGLGISGTSRTSFFADRIAASIPKEFRLTAMNIFPRTEGSIEDEDNYTFSRDVIEIKGSCRQSSELNEWMNAVRKLDFVREAALLSYNQDNARDPGKFAVALKIR